MALVSYDVPDRCDRRVAVGGLNFHVTEWGDPRSEDAIVLSHPTGFLGAVWKPLIARLRGLGVTSRILTYDQRGHGLSSKPDDDYEWERFVNDTVGLLRALDLRDVYGIGHSAGATTLAGVAAAEPSLISRLVMIDPVLFHPKWAKMFEEGGENPMATRTKTRRMVWPSRDELCRSYSDREPYSTWTDEALRAYVDEGTFERPDGEVELLCPARVEAQVYSAAAGFDAFAMLKAVQAPLLLLQGEHSTTFEETRARLALEAAPHARLVVVKGTGHFIPMERPDEVADLLVAEQAAGA